MIKMTTSKSKNVCRFCAIAQKIEPAYIIFEDNNMMIFLDKKPLFPGHCLLIPKAHFSTFEDLPHSYIEPFFSQVQKLSQAIMTAMKSEGTFTAINNRISQSVPHLHVHVVPRNHQDGLRGFFWPRHSYRDEQHIKETQLLLQQAWQGT